MVEIKIHLYKFDELEDSAKRQAINSHRYFMIDTLRPDYFDGLENWNDPEKMKMYWEEVDYINENDEPVIESIQINDYYFFQNGHMCNCQTYHFDDKTPETIAFIYGEAVEVRDNATN